MSAILKVLIELEFFLTFFAEFVAVLFPLTRTYSVVVKNISTFSALFDFFSISVNLL